MRMVAARIMQRMKMLVRDGKGRTMKVLLLTAAAPLPEPENRIYSLTLSFLCLYANWKTKNSISMLNN